MRIERLTACVDLNGVLDHFQGWTGKYEDYPVRDDARKLLVGLQDRGYRVVILTARTNLEGVHNWLADNGLAEWVDEVTNIKPPAYIYIDDRAVRFNGDVRETLDEIDNFKPHWQR